ncbi:MAG: fructosamine kinase family protein [Bacteroidota bacterium]
MLPKALIHLIEKKTGLQLQAVNPLGGGCIHYACRLETNQGRFFLKYNHKREADNFRCEALGLGQLTQAASLRVPELVATDADAEYAFLILEWMESGRPAADYWQQLGTGLAQLHQITQPHFGWKTDNYIGRLPQSNEVLPEWTHFFVQARLQPMLKMAVDTGKMNASDIKVFDRLFGKMSTLFPPEKPALIHGDLWGGNLMTDQHGAPVLIDPSVHFAHREMEIAFMTLFDRQPAAFYQAYEAISPLAPGWQSRIDLCNLYPLLVHVNLFGGGYVQSVRRIIQSYA